MSELSTAEILASWEAPPARPPIRWGGVVWGLILIGIGSMTLFVVSSPGRIRAIQTWVTQLDAGEVWALVLAVAGAIIVVLALLGVIRGSQRRQERAGRA